jgi:hypothetical protein
MCSSSQPCCSNQGHEDISNSLGRVYSLHKRARIRAFYAEAVAREKLLLPWTVETLPTLLHISLLLFFAGLVVVILTFDRNTSCVPIERQYHDFQVGVINDVAGEVWPHALPLARQGGAHALVGTGGASPRAGARRLVGEAQP